MKLYEIMYLYCITHDREFSWSKYWKCSNIVSAVLIIGLAVILVWYFWWYSL